MNKKELIEEIISEDWRQIRVDGMLVEKSIEYEMILDQLINRTKEEIMNKCIENVEAIKPNKIVTELKLHWCIIQELKAIRGKL